MSFVVRGLLGVASIVYPSVALAQTAPASTPAPPAPLRVYMRNQGAPLTFSAQPKSGREKSTWCISPCDAHLLPGEYKLELNGVEARDSVTLRQPGTLHGAYESYQGTRSGAWLSLNVGGIIGGVFITVAAAGGPKATAYIGAGVLAGATAIFFITYRSDKASVSFTPDPPPDVRDMPPPASMNGARHAALDRPSFDSTPRGLGFRLAF